MSLVALSFDTATTEIYTLSLHELFRSRWSPYSDQDVLETGHARGIGQGSLQIPAKVLVAHHHGVDQTTPERLADNTGQRLKAEQPDGQHPAAPDKALLLRLQRVIEPEQVGFCLFARDASGGRQIGQHLQGVSTNELIR